VGGIRDTFPLVFRGGRRNKPHCQAIRDLSENWGFQKVIMDLAHDKIEKVAEINQLYVTDTFTFLTYLIQKGEAEEDEMEFQENLRKAKSKGRH
jgi:hypothetical protein